MQDFLRKIKLIDHLTTELQMDKQTFVNRLSAITDEGSTGLLSNPFDAFSSSKNEYKGTVTFDSFKLKRRKKAFDTNYNLSTAKGILIEKDGKLRIETEINGFNSALITIYLPLIVFYSVFIFSIVSDKKEPFPIFLFLFIHCFFIFIFFIPYSIVKRSVQRLKYELEREFFYLTKND